MRAMMQRVDHASVSVEGKVVGSIETGLLVFLGVTNTDTDAEMTLLADKLLKLRLFADANDKTNCSLADIGGSLLVISQFTLCADCRKGTRPSFSGAAPPDKANRLYEAFLAYCRQSVPIVESGVFGAHMQVELCNHGPFTIWLDTDDLRRPRNASK